MLGGPYKMNPIVFLKNFLFRISMMGIIFFYFYLTVLLLIYYGLQFCIFMTMFLCVSLCVCVSCAVSMFLFYSVSFLNLSVF